MNLSISLNIFYGVKQVPLLNYLSTIDSSSFISSIKNGFIIMCDKSFEIDKETIFSMLQNLDFLSSYVVDLVPDDKKALYADHLEKQRKSLLLERGLVDIPKIDSNYHTIVNEFIGNYECNLSWWALHITKQFSCSSISISIRDVNKSWYQFSSHGLKLCEIISSSNRIKHKDYEVPFIFDSTHNFLKVSSDICTAFNLENKVEVLSDIFSGVSISKLLENEPDYAYSSCNEINRLKSICIIFNIELEILLGCKYKDLLANNIRLNNIFAISKPTFQSVFKNTSKVDRNYYLKYLKKYKKTKGITLGNTDQNIDLLYQTKDAMVKQLEKSNTPNMAIVLNDLVNAIKFAGVRHDVFENPLLDLIIIFEVTIFSNLSQEPNANILKIVRRTALHFFVELMDRSFLTPAYDIWEMHKESLLNWCEKSESKSD